MVMIKEDRLPTSGFLKEIISVNEEGKDMIFVCNIGKAVSFDSHFGAYIIDVQQPEHIKCFLLHLLGATICSMHSESVVNQSMILVDTCSFRSIE